MNPDDREQEERLTAQKAAMLGRQYTDTRLLQAIDPITNLISLEEMTKFGIVPLSHSAYKVVVGFTDKTKRSNLDKLQQRLPQVNLDLSLISASGFEEILDRYYRASHKVNPEIYKQLSLQQKLDQVRQHDLFLQIAQQAYGQDASDIHIEPTQKAVVVRYRIDGVLHPVATLPYDRYEILLTELQTNAGIKWNVDYPQTGRIRAELIGKQRQPVEV